MNWFYNLGANISQNIELVLFRAVDAPWRIGWRLDQQFVKNNKDPENTMYAASYLTVGFCIMSAFGY